MSVEALLLARSLPFLICTLEIFTWRFWNFYEHHISSETSLTPVHSTQFIFLSSLSFLNCRKINISDFTERHKRYFTSRRHKPFVDYLDEMTTTNRFSSLRFLTPIQSLDRKWPHMENSGQYCSSNSWEHYFEPKPKIIPLVTFEVLSRNKKKSKLISIVTVTAAIKVTRLWKSSPSLEIFA